jgi:hypothetical protein
MSLLRNTISEREKSLTEGWQATKKLGKEFPYEVDFVVLWVEDDLEHRRERQKTSNILTNRKNRNSFGFDNQKARFRDNEELLYCLRSVVWCMPWIRKIHVVVANYQFPTKYISDGIESPGVAFSGPEICIVPHSAILPPNHLPTFNSQAIEAHLHRIPGLCDRFIYSNDDFMVASQIDPAYFFDSETGSPRYNLENTHVPDKSMSSNMSKHSMAWTNNSRLLNLIFGATSSGKRLYPCHQMVPMLTTSFREVWSHRSVQPLLRRTSRSPFRTCSNMYLIGFLVYWNFYLHGAKRRSHVGCFYHDCEAGDNVKALMRHIITSQPVLLCINDGGYGNKERRIIAMHLKKMYPLPTPWEPDRTIHPAMLDLFNGN